MTRMEAMYWLRHTTWLGVYNEQKNIEEAIEMAIEALKQPEQEWILCSERLPEPNKHYLITVKFNGEIYVTSDDYFWYGWDDYGDDVIAWMELPEPYREEKS